MTTQTRLMTAEELLDLPDDDRRYELIRGELLTMAPAGEEHGLIAHELALSLGQHVKGRDLGRVYAAETGFKLSSNPDTVRAPDIAFISRANFEDTAPSHTFREGAPDLVVEVISPNDRASEVEIKVRDWLSHGAKMVVTVNPRAKLVTVYRGPDNIHMLSEGDVLDGGDVVPGWQLPLDELFAPL